MSENRPRLFPGCLWPQIHAFVERDTPWSPDDCEYVLDDDGSVVVFGPRRIVEVRCEITVVESK